MPAELDQHEQLSHPPPLGRTGERRRRFARADSGEVGDVGLVLEVAVEQRPDHGELLLGGATVDVGGADQHLSDLLRLVMDR